MNDVAWKALGTGSAVLSGIAATKVADLIWRKVGGGRHLDPHNPNEPLLRALGYAALTGLLAGAARTFAQRKAAQFYARSTGHLPEDVAGYKA